MRPLKIAIPAGKNSFHHRAAKNYFGTYHQVLHSESMREVLLLLEQNVADYAVLACYNTIAGRIHEAYRLVEEFHHVMIDEITLNISLCMAGKTSGDVKKISKVFSNQYALVQSEELLDRLQISDKESVNDTVKAAQLVAKALDDTHACICSVEVATENGLKILYDDVQLSSNNETKFLIISKSGRSDEKSARPLYTPIYISL